MPLDDADKAFIANLLKEATSAEKLTPIVSEAAKAHVTAAIGGLKLDEKLKGITDAVAALKPADDPNKGKDDKGNKDGKGEPSAEVAQLRAAIETEKKAREEAEAGRKRDALDGAARDSLLKAGVPADRIRHAMAVLKADGVLDYTADGKPGWKGKDKFGVDGVVAIEDGASAWTKTDDGKAFMPPTGAQGDGLGGGNNSRMTPGPAKLSDLASSGAASRFAAAIAAAG